MTRPTRVVRTSLAVATVVSFTGGVVRPEPRAQTLQPDPVAWMLFVDDLHLQFRNTGRLRSVLRTIVRDLPNAQDAIAIRTSGPSTLLTDFTSGSLLAPQISKLSGNGLRVDDIVAAPSDREVRYRTQLSLSLATSAALVLGQSDQFRRAMIYISEGHPLDVTQLPEGRALAQAASVGGVRVFVIDGRIVHDDTVRPAVPDARWDEYVTSSRNSLRAIAEQSGGFAVFDRDELPDALRRIGDSIR